MGGWAGMQVITRELREDLGERADEVVARMMREECERQGYHPVDHFMLSWYEVSQHEFDLEAAALLPYGCPPAFRVGDWRVRGVTVVREDAEIR